MSGICFPVLPILSPDIKLAVLISTGRDSLILNVHPPTHTAIRIKEKIIIVIVWSTVSCTKH